MASAAASLARWRPAWRRAGRQRAPRPERPVSVASAVIVFAATGLAALALISAGVFYFTRQAATDEAVNDARRVTEVVGRGLIVPALGDGIPARDAAALARIDSVVRQDVLGDSIVRVKIWAPDGTIVYSDETRLVGQRFALGNEEVEAFQDGRAAAEVSDLTRPENEFERQWGKLLEVYLPVHTPGGSPLLFEAYLPYSFISSNSNQIWQNFLPVLIAGLVLLELVQLPLAWSLAHRLRRRQRERESLLQRAMEASERERRLIAGELHDGAVQELVAHSYQLAATADRLEGRAPADAVATIRAASARARSTVQGLRTLLVDLYPMNLRSAGMEAALEDLAAPLRAAGVDVTLTVQPGFRPAEKVERLLYRAAREALRNVHQHAGAQSVQVRVARAGTRALLTVTDDGRGFAPAEREARRARGHLGLDLLGGLAADAGGQVTLERDAKAGLTRFAIEVPFA